MCACSGASSSRTRTFQGSRRSNTLVVSPTPGLTKLTVEIPYSACTFPTDSQPAQVGVRSESSHAARESAASPRTESNAAKTTPSNRLQPYTLASLDEQLPTRKHPDRV